MVTWSPYIVTCHNSYASYHLWSLHVTCPIVMFTLDPDMSHGCVRLDRDMSHGCVRLDREMSHGCVHLDRDMWHVPCRACSDLQHDSRALNSDGSCPGALITAEFTKCRPILWPCTAELQTYTVTVYGRILDLYCYRVRPNCKGFDQNSARYHAYMRNEIPIFKKIIIIH